MSQDETCARNDDGGDLIPVTRSPSPPPQPTQDSSPSLPTTTGGDWVWDSDLGELVLAPCPPSPPLRPTTTKPTAFDTTLATERATMDCHLAESRRENDIRILTAEICFRATENAKAIAAMESGKPYVFLDPWYKELRERCARYPSLLKEYEEDEERVRLTIERRLRHLQEWASEEELEMGGYAEIVTLTEFNGKREAAEREAEQEQENVDGDGQMEGLVHQGRGSSEPAKVRPETWNSGQGMEVLTDSSVAHRKQMGENKEKKKERKRVEFALPPNLWRKKSYHN
ncbi:hypothetical protein P154DRAFT_565920 [Amniculicola lignicola CBS 123094]|uniref:Uncharacterized protein n=1 Tax=Amniculicola lignicola CBS 123094 TaxID=1392246 RepID=A0A6A5W432_9PLEO|nr:hypothetical protein P154DRAFT_565920 [Amniculicola lignicola CBS 123094]